MTLSIRQRLTVWYAMAVTVILIGSAAAVLAVEWRLSLDRLDAELHRLNGTLAAVLQGELAEGLAPIEAAEDCLDDVNAAGRHVAILRADGSVLGHRWSLPGGVPMPPAAGWGDVTSTVGGVAGYRLISAVAPPVPAGFVVLTAGPTQELLSARATLMQAMLLVMPVALLLSTAGSWWVAGRVLRPASTMAQQARLMTEASAGQRLTVAKRDELGLLAQAFNELLDRLDSALDVRRRFLADASHELRTPVSIAQSAADIALSQPSRPEAEYRETLTLIGAQLKRLGRMITDMLTLARSDVAAWPMASDSFYLDDVLEDVANSTRLLGQARGIDVRLTAPGDLQYRGDEGLLRQMLLNLLDNAVRHTPAGGTVRLEASLSPISLEISVADSGSGIPDVDQGRIFERFVRVRPSTASEGLGLGLAIVRRIARAHGGEARLDATGPDGSTFVVSLPRQPVSAG